jgi:hypothetical protein
MLNAQRYKSTYPTDSGLACIKLQDSCIADVHKDTRCA